MDRVTGQKNESYVYGSQVATRDMFVVYPNGDKSTNVVIKGCVLVRTKSEAAGTDSKKHGNSGFPSQSGRYRTTVMTTEPF